MCYCYLYLSRGSTEKFVRKCHPARAGTDGAHYKRWHLLSPSMVAPDCSHRVGELQHQLQSRFRCHRLHVGTDLASDFGLPKLHHEKARGRPLWQCTFSMVLLLRNQLLWAASIFEKPSAGFYVNGLSDLAGTLKCQLL